MQWYRAKTILIVFFVIINAALLLYLTVDRVTNSRANGVVLESTVELLKKNGISVDYELIKNASSPDKIKNVYAQNVIGNYSYFAENILGDDIASENKNSFKSPIGTVTFTADRFEARAKDGKYLFESEKDIKNPQTFALQYVKYLGFEADRSMIRKTNSYSDGITTVIFNKKFNSKEVFDAVLAAELDEKGIKAIYGTWFNERKTTMAPTDLKGISGVLIEYMNMQRDASKEIVIKNITLGYAVGDNDIYHESVMLTPVWKIEVEKGESVLIDAREN